MKYIDEFRNENTAISLSKNIASLAKGHDTITIMEVCGSHTMSVYKYGLKKLLPQNIRLLSGPGCPVCVTPVSYIDTAVSILHKYTNNGANNNNITIATFGDLMKVPGSYSSLENEKSKGAHVAVVYSTLDALKLAKRYPERFVIFMAIGFETTAPTVAASVIEAEKRGLKNYFLLTSHKIMPPVMKSLLNSRELNIHGFLCPAHVSTIIGSKPYEFIARDYNIACVIAGFEPLDILYGIYMLLEQIIKKAPCVNIQYSRVVKPEGNPTALALLDKTFEPYDAEWRGMGVIPESGLKLKSRYERFDALTLMQNKSGVRNPKSEIKGCMCGDILRGVKTPNECKLFKKVCSPEHPVGACMVSSEGTCAAYYKYGE